MRLGVGGRGRRWRGAGGERVVGVIEESEASGLQGRRARTACLVGKNCGTFPQNNRPANFPDLNYLSKIYVDMYVSKRI
jgi:hypothetical protein